MTAALSSIDKSKQFSFNGFDEPLHVIIWILYDIFGSYFCFLQEVIDHPEMELWRFTELPVTDICSAKPSS